mgnify:CR=1 FL=1
MGNQADINNDVILILIKLKKSVATLIACSIALLLLPALLSTVELVAGIELASKGQK